jgi:uncharacterized membrane protein YjfL (UPF0719 family)
LLCTVLLAGIFCALAPVAAPVTAFCQSPQDNPVISDPSAPAEPFIDRKVGTVKDRYSRFMARMKKEHFREYLLAYCAVLAGVTGLIFGFLSYRLSDPMSPYKLIKKRAMQLALAIGGSIGIFGAVMQVPPNTTGKVSLLLLAIGVGALAAVLAAWTSFGMMRLRSNYHAKRDGRRITDRMRHA